MPAKTSTKKATAAVDHRPTTRGTGKGKGKGKPPGAPRPARTTKTTKAPTLTCEVCAERDAVHASCGYCSRCCQARVKMAAEFGQPFVCDGGPPARPAALLPEAGMEEEQRGGWTRLRATWKALAEDESKLDSIIKEEPWTADGSLGDWLVGVLGLGATLEQAVY